MAIPVIQLDNQTGSPITLGQLGVVVPASGSIVITGQTGDVYVASVLDDRELHTYIDSGDISLTVDSTALTVEQSKAYAAPHSGVAPLKDNLSATTDPGTGDDDADGYSVGSKWINTSADTLFNCTDASTSAAVWQKNGTFVGGRLYDAVVDIGGAGDYTSIAAAFTAGAKSVFVRTGTYTETSDIDIPTGGFLVGEDAVAINLSGAVSVSADGSGGTAETAGTISITSGTSAVTGSGTTFTNLAADDWIAIGCTFYEIASISTDTSLTLVETYEGTTQTGISYIAQTMFVGISIENVKIENSSGTGLYLRAVTRATLTDVTVESCLLNVQVVDCGEVVFRHLVTAYSTGDGLEIDGGRTIIIEETYATANGGLGIDVVDDSVGIILDASRIDGNSTGGVNVTGTSDDVVISDSRIVRNAGYGINTEPSTSHCLIDTCIIEDNGSYGIDFDGDDNLVSACLIAVNGDHGIRMGDDGVVLGCHVEDNVGNGIDCTGDPNGTISGCNIHDNTADGIYVDGDSDNCVITGCRIFDNTSDGIEIATGAENTKLIGNRVTGHTTDINDSGTNTEYSVEAIGQASQGDVIYNDGTYWQRLAAGTDGQFLQTQGAGANPQWASGGGGGGASTQVTATALAQTTSSTFVLMTGMSITPGAGDYLVSWSGSLTNSTNNTEVDVAVYVNGVQEAASVRRYDNLASGDTIPSSIAAYKVTGVGGGEAIEIRWRRSGGTASVWQRNMTVQETS